MSYASSQAPESLMEFTVSEGSGPPAGIYKAEFLGVKRSFIPIQAIVRIDEVEKGGVSKITSGDNITLFPVPYMTARNTDTQKSE